MAFGCSPSSETRQIQVSPDPSRGSVEVESPLHVSEKIPLVIVLHGFKANAWIQNWYFGLSRYVRKKHFHLVALEGTKNSDGDRFWNASSSCCNLERSGVDDVAYISNVIKKIKQDLPVSRVYIVGHSNGGFMAYRMLCEDSSVDGILSLAGVDSDRPCRRDPSLKTTIIHVHGHQDDVISDQGGKFKNLEPYPDVASVLKKWSERLKCGDPTFEVKNYSKAIWGDDSILQNFRCEADNSLHDVRIEKGSHMPWINDSFREEMLNLLLNQ